MTIANGAQFSDGFGGIGPILLPVMIAGVGIVASILGTFLVNIKNNEAKEAQVQKALDLGNWTSIILTLAASYFLIDWITNSFIVDRVYKFNLILYSLLFIFMLKFIIPLSFLLITSFSSLAQSVGKDWCLPKNKYQRNK